MKTPIEAYAIPSFRSRFAMARSFLLARHERARFGLVGQCQCRESLR